MVTGYGSDVRIKHFSNGESFLYRGAISTGPGDGVLLTGNDLWGNRGEGNVGLSEDCGHIGRACDEKGKVLHFCKNNELVMWI